MFPLGILKRARFLDPAKIKLLLHFDGNFTDSSPNSYSVSTGGAVSTSGGTPKFGTGDLVFGVTPTRNGFVKSPNIFDFGLQRPFTISFFYKGGDTSGCYFTTRDSAVYTPMELLKAGTFLVANAALNNWTMVTSNLSISSTVYKHCAIVGDGTNIKVYSDGSLVASTAHPNWPSASRFVQLGKTGDSQYSNGSMDEFLLYDGVLWSSNFTPPTQPFT